MKYIQIDIKLTIVDPYSEILIARLDQLNFDSFFEYKNGLKAYVNYNLYDQQLFDNVLNDLPNDVVSSFSISELENKNWNARWEDSFSPVHVTDNCVVRADFHKSFPEKEFDIIITPKMSFGTGHHATTSLMMCKMCQLDFSSKIVLDVGTGTGVLSILASKKQAKHIIAVDNDEWAYKNSQENILLNSVSNIDLIQGDISAVKDKFFDILLVNINRNIILSQITTYYNLMTSQADILLSGFLIDDMMLILNKIEQIGFELICSENKNEWQLLHLRKN